MEGLSALKTIYASKRPMHSKPAWRVACMGLNVEAMCLNAQCRAFASRVRCQRGFGVFDAAEAVLCPNCDSPGTVAIRIGLIGCQWMIQGDHPPKWRQSGRQEYHRFGLHGARRLGSLIVTTKALAINQSNRVTTMEHDADNRVASFGALQLKTSIEERTLALAEIQRKHEHCS